MSEHPGSVLFVDGRTDEILRVERADQLPRERCFVDGQPVVRVVIFDEEGGRRRTLHEYGADRELLRTSIQERAD